MFPLFVAFISRSHCQRKQAVEGDAVGRCQARDGVYFLHYKPTLTYVYTYVNIYVNIFFIDVRVHFRSALPRRDSIEVLQQHSSLARRFPDMHDLRAISSL